MQSTPNPRETDPHDVFVIEPDVVLAARADKAPLDRLYDVLTDPPGPQADPAAELLAAPSPRIDPKFDADNAGDAAAPGEIRIDELEASDRRPRSGGFARFAKRVLVGAFLLAGAVSAAAWQHYGGDAKAVIAKWTPSFALASSPPAETPAAAGQPAAADTQVSAQTAPVDSAALDKAAAPPPAAAQSSEVAAPAAAASTAPATAPVVAQDSAKLLRSMARDLASMNQQIDELKASIEQLKAGQAQLAQDAAKAAEAKAAEAKAAEAKAAEAKTSEAKPQASNPRRRTATPPVRAAAAHAHRPKQTFPYRPIAPARPYPTAAPVQLQPSMQAQATTDGQPVLRPPMPLR